jgi:hypothetical protein
VPSLRRRVPFSLLHLPPDAETSTSSCRSLHCSRIVHWRAPPSESLIAHNNSRGQQPWRIKVLIATDITSRTTQVRQLHRKRWMMYNWRWESNLFICTIISHENTQSHFLNTNSLELLDCSSFHKRRSYWHTKDITQQRCLLHMSLKDEVGKDEKVDLWSYVAYYLSMRDCGEVESDRCSSLPTL